MTPTQEPESTITRDVSLTFDFMVIESTYKTSESLLGKLLDTAGSVASAGANMLNM